MLDAKVYLFRVKEDGTREYEDFTYCVALTLEEKLLKIKEIVDVSEILEAVWFTGSLLKYGHTAITVSKNSGISAVTFDIFRKPSGKSFESAKELVNELSNPNRNARAYFNSAFLEKYNIDQYKTWAMTNRGLIFLKNATGNPITFNKNSAGGELCGFHNQPFLTSRYRRYDLKPFAEDGFSILLKDYITLENEHVRSKEPLLTIK